MHRLSRHTTGLPLAAYRQDGSLQHALRLDSTTGNRRRPGQRTSADGTLRIHRIFPIGARQTARPLWNAPHTGPFPFLAEPAE